MQIVVFHSHYFDHVPAPAGTAVTEADISAGRAVKVADDRYLLRVHLPAPGGETHTARGEHESSICNFLVFAELFPSGRWVDEWEQFMRSAGVSRASVVAYFTAKQMRTHGKQKHFSRVVVHDDGPIESVFRAAAQRYLDEGHAKPAQIDALVATYLADKADVGAYLTKFFEIGGKP